MQKQLLLLALILLFTPSFAFAQDNNNDNGGAYVPPPMFGAPKFPEPNDTSKRPLKLPPLSKKIEIPEEEKEKSGTLIRGRIFKQVDDDAPIPAAEKHRLPKPTTNKLTTKKPVDEEQRTAPINIPKPLEKPAFKKVPPPPSFTPAKTPPKSSRGVVKGPKTMPAVKKNAVEAETTFDGGDEPALNILDRVTQDNEKEIVKKREVKKALLSPNSNLQDFETLPNGAQKILIPYQGTQTDLTEDQKTLLNQRIIPELDKNLETKLSMEAFAGAQEGVLRSDRRIALSRAMAIRAYLLEQEISPDRINVRALGAETNTQPLDRVDIYLKN